MTQKLQGLTLSSMSRQSQSKRELSLCIDAALNQAVLLSDSVAVAVFPGATYNCVI